MQNLTYFAVLFLAGCVSAPPEVYEREYREIPEGYLQPCELPGAPLVNGDLSEAFVVAYKCGEQGNRDKQRIRELLTP
jgi:thiamine monophosphate kinase